MSHRLMSIIVKANARYFVKQGWEQPELLDKLDRWLGDKQDTRLSKKIESWFLCDARWTKEVSPGMLRYFWYIAPVILFVSWYMHRLLLKWAKEVGEWKAS